MAEIIFWEGSDYTGKTTAIKYIKEYYESRNKKVLILKEPFGKFREMLLSKEDNLHEQTRRLLFIADHIEVMSEIFKSKDDYDIILIDRVSIVSDFIYMREEIEDKYILSKTMENSFKNYMFVDKTYFKGFFANNTHLFIIDIDKSDFLKRLKSRGINEKDLFDSKQNSFKEKIWKSYNQMIHLTNLSHLRPYFKSIQVIGSKGLLASAIDIIEGELSSGDI